MTPELPLRDAFVRLTPAGKLSLAALALAVIVLSVRLWPEWRSNPDLSHGIFMPLVFLLLLHEGRTHGTRRHLAPSGLVWIGFGVLLLGGIAALSVAGLYASAVDWNHAVVNFVLTGAVVLFLGAALVAFSTAGVRLIGFNWAAIAAVFLWLLCAPIPPGTYSRLTLSLQLWVSEAVLQSLHLLGVAAIRQGNIIKLAHTTVGVEEACSGVRSLISCVFAGFFFSATLVRRPWPRVWLIALAAPLALGMNFLRSLALTLMSNSGIDITGRWHDLTGFAVLGVTASLLGGLALLFARGTTAREPRAVRQDLAVSANGMQRTLGTGVLLAAVLAGVFIFNTRPAANRNVPAPDLLALLPASPPGWNVTTTDLYEFQGTLRTEHLAQRRYTIARPNGPTTITIYVAYWRPGQAPVSLVASHTPDACWPGAGWTPLPGAKPRAELVVGGRMLFPAEHRLFKAGGLHHEHVWFWHLYAGRPLSYQDPYSAAELLRLAVRFGFRHQGEQLFVRLSSNRPWSEIGAEPLLAEFFSRTADLGL